MNFLISFSKLVSCKELWEFDQNWGELFFFPCLLNVNNQNFILVLHQDVVLVGCRCRQLTFWFAKLLYLLHLFPLLHLKFKLICMLLLFCSDLVHCYERLCTVGWLFLCTKP